MTRMAGGLAATSGIEAGTKRVPPAAAIPQRDDECTLAYSLGPRLLQSMLGWSLNLFRIRGILLAVHFSFFLLLAINAFSGWSEAGLSGLIWDTAILLAFFVCV